MNRPGYVPPKSQHWGTPKDIVDAVRTTFDGKIDLDPCSNAHSLVGASTSYRLPDQDGLVEPWVGDSIYVNPPYSRCRMRLDDREFFDGDSDTWAALPDAEKKKYRVTTIGHWIGHCGKAAKNGAHVIALIPSTPEVISWRKHVWKQSASICFLNKRVYFLDPDTGQPAQASIPKPIVAILWLGAKDPANTLARFEESFGELGNCVRPAN